MKQIVVFVCIVLVTLSMVNAIPHGLHSQKLHKRDTEFKQCPSGAPLKVKLSPDPGLAGQNGIFDVSGKAEEAIPLDSVLAIAFVKTDSTPEDPKFIGEPFAIALCDDQDAKCPVEPGKSFGKKVAILTPNELPSKYAVIVAVAGPDKRVLNCAYTVVGDNLVPEASQIVTKFKF